MDRGEPLTLLRISGTESTSERKVTSVRVNFFENAADAALHLQFPGTRFLLEDDEISQIKAWVQRRHAAGANAWRLHTTIDESDPQDKRGGYLRLMSTRSVLLAAGIEPNTITTQLIRSSQRLSTADRQVNIVPDQRSQ